MELCAQPDTTLHASVTSTNGISLPPSPNGISKNAFTCATDECKGLEGEKGNSLNHS